MDNPKLFVYTLKAEDEGKKYEDILSRRFHFSRKVLQKLKLGENVRADGKFVFLSSRGRAGQTLTVDLTEEETSTIKGENLPLDILYEDDFFLAVNKPPGQVVHPTARYQSGTLANAVVGYWEQKGEFRPFRPVSRIDRNTSGIVLIAKNRYAHQQLAWLSAHNRVLKKYWGLVEGFFPWDEGEFSGSIRLKPGSKIVREIHPEGLPSLTIYRTLKRLPNYSLLEFTLVTGRTHQIRVHCQGAGYPLLGDELYGGDQTYIARQALHCRSYAFRHPFSDEEIKIEAPLPYDMRLLL
ncbi:MAG TPA: RluA family pseudouridine synthase [Peptococcaceae bacterium]|nr:RluA family pseudouridine synthase [Peptococcaceae bacterium]